jgi:UDP-GlcNAc:undecaprenyl-phosphate GlcNAc-1-phosphate transferase
MAELALLVFAPALVLAGVLTPLARMLALATGLVAAVRPDRLHREPRPYGGGLAIAATLAAVGLPAVAWVLPQSLDAGGRGDLTDEFVRLGIGGVLFFIIGLLDDRYALPALPKLLLQFAAAAVVVAGLGIRATVWLTVPHAGDALSIVWIVAVANAYNMLDHADGVAACCGLVALLALAAGQLALGEAFAGAMALLAAGALAGFLIHNFPPAKLFMGDAGSSLVGYLLAALTMEGRYYFEGITPSRWVVLVPAAILAVPLFDMVCVAAGRLARRRNPMAGDATSHLAHRMLARGTRPRVVVLFCAAMSAVTGAASVMMYRAEGLALLAAWAVVAAAMAMMMIARRPRKAKPQADAGAAR